MRLRVWVALCLGVGVAAGCGNDEPPVGTMTYEAAHYDYSFDLETRAAATSVTIRVLEGGDCLDIGMRASDLADVLLDDEAAAGSLDGGVLHACGSGWFADDELVLRATMTIPDETWGDSQVGYSVSTDLEDAPFYYLVSWVNGCDRFGPCDARPDTFATYTFTVTHPSGTAVLCPGVITAGDTETVCDFAYGGGPTYSTFGVVASPSWQTTDLGDWGGVHATLYDMPSTGIGEDFKADQHEAFLAWMVDRFGPYPYGDELRFATGPTYWAGFEHPGNIVINDRLGQGPAIGDPLAHSTNHEMVHMWAGDQTTLAAKLDFVWKEAMANYLPTVFDDEEVSPSLAAASMRSWKERSRSSQYYPVPGEDPPLLDYFGSVYSPGPMVFFRQIEALYDRDTVITALQSLLGQTRAIGVADVQAALEDATGADLTAYFDQWIYGEGIPARPVFAVSVQDAGGGDYDVSIDQQNPEAGAFGCAFAIQLVGASADETYDAWFDLGVDGKTTMTVRATPGFTVTSHVFDPYSHSLAQDVATAMSPAPPRINEWVAPVAPVPYRRY